MPWACGYIGVASLLLVTWDLQRDVKKTEWEAEIDAALISHIQLTPSSLNTTISLALVDRFVQVLMRQPPRRRMFVLGLNLRDVLLGWRAQS